VSESTGPGPSGGPSTAAGEAAAAPPSLAKIAAVFGTIGATSFGGGVVAYLRNALVERERWLDDRAFLRVLELAQTLPGLNTVNVAVIAGDEMRGLPGAFVAALAVIVPGLAVVTGLGAVYATYAHDPWLVATLAGAAAAAVGLLVSVTVQIGRRQLADPRDFVIVLGTAVAVGYLRLSLVWVVLIVGGVAIWLHRPGTDGERGPEA
jgi:chromate transporter